MKHHVILMAALAVAGCATDPDRVPQSQRTWTPQGAPVSCINTRTIRSTHVVDDQTINFFINNNRMFRNELPFRCSGLSFNRAFKHNSRTGQLCSTNTITVLQGGNMRGPTCQLGRFQPMVPTDTLPPVAMSNVPPPKP